MPTAWKGTISFGLVNIPITLYPAFKSKDLEFHLLHKQDHGRIGYQKVCKRCGKILAPEDIVKAFQQEKDVYVPLEKEELDAGKAPNTRNLEISLFVSEDEIDPKLYERPYYIMPARNAENLYVLLREAIRASGMVGVGKIQFGNREHLAALKCDGPAILLNLMHFAEEMEDPESLHFPAENAPLGKKELELAKQLVGTLKGHFRAEEYANAHREALEATIRKKAGATVGKRGKGAAATAANAKVIDLMERLKQSLDGGKGKASGKAVKAAKDAAKAAKAPVEDHAHSERHYHRKKAG
jgi:DNA end-binding protein Ku